MTSRQFHEFSVKDFVEAIAAHTPTPGGGTASVAASLLGTALGLMVVQFSDGINPQIKIALEDLKTKLYPLMDKDACAYETFKEAQKLPKTTEEEKATRTRQLQEALAKAAEVPLEGCKLSFEVLRNLNNIAISSNKNLISDLGAAALLLVTGLRGCAFNVQINAKGIKNQMLKRGLLSATQNILAEADQIQKQILQEVQKAME